MEHHRNTGNYNGTLGTSGTQELVHGTLQLDTGNQNGNIGTAETPCRNVNGVWGQVEHWKLESRAELLQFELLLCMLEIT